MQDPLITLVNCIKDGWTLTGDLAKANIRFSTGWYDKAFAAPQVTVSELFEIPVVWELGYGTIRYFAVYQVDVWVKLLRLTGKGPGKAKEWRWAMRKHIKSILKANLTGLTDLKLVVLNQTGRNLDEIGETPPLLRYSLPVEVQYEI